MKAQETVVIFIEFQNDFCKPQGVFYDLVQEELARLDTIANGVKLLAAAREKRTRVVHCPFVFDADWMQRHQCVGLLDVIGKNEAFQPNTWGAAIIEEMEPLPQETVLTGKHALSAFTNTELSHVFKTGGYRNLLVCGFLTNVCAQATAISAYDRGLNTRMVVDACASGGRAIQDYVEQNVCPILGGPLTTAEAIALLQ